MITTLSSITPEQAERAVLRAQKRQPAVTITEQGDGFIRADVECGRTCGEHMFIYGVHDVVISHSGALTCSCPASKGVCLHIAAVLAWNGGALPEAPKSCEQRGCGGQLMYWDGGNGHAASCPEYPDGPRYEAPQSETARRIAAGALREPTRWGERLQERLKDVEFAQEFAAQPAAIAGGRQRTIDKTRPSLMVTRLGDIVIRRACGHIVATITADIGVPETLPLSPFEGCPECRDPMTPPAPDQVAARQEAQ